MEQKTWILHRRRFWDDYDHIKKYKITLIFRKMKIKTTTHPVELLKLKMLQASIYELVELLEISRLLSGI